MRSFLSLPAAFTAVTASVVLLACTTPRAVSVEELQLQSQLVGTPTLGTTPDAPLPADVAPLHASACSFRAARYSDRPVPMTFSEGGSPLVAFRSAELDLSLQETGALKQAVAEVKTAHFSLRGLVELAKVHFRPSHPLTLSGFVTPTASARLLLTRVTEGQVGLTLDPPRGLEVVGPPLRGMQACGDITIEPLSEKNAFEARGAVIPLGVGTNIARLAPEHPVELAMDPGGAVVARLSPPDGHEVEVFEQRGPFSRVLWLTQEAAIFGWVPTGDLRPGGGGTRSNTGGIPGRTTMATGDSVVCGSDVAVVAVGPRGERSTIGTIHPDSVMKVVEKTSPFTTVVVADPEVQLNEGVKLQVRAKDISGCTLR